jgi:CBS domain-containing protein
MLERVPFLDEYGERSLLEVDISPELGVLCIVDDLMNRNVITISGGMTTFEARSLMKLHKIRRLPVVDEEGHLIGIVSLFDIILAVFKKKGVL